MNKLIGKITQEGTNEPSIVLFDQEVIAIASTQYITVGECKVTLNVGILNNGYAPRWFTCDSTGHIYAISAISTTEIAIQVFESDGTPSDGRLSSNYFEIAF